MLPTNQQDNVALKDIKSTKFFQTKKESSEFKI